MSNYLNFVFISKSISLNFNLNSAAAAKSLQSCPTVQPHRWQPTRLPHPWDSPGKNTGVGCHFLLQCMKVKSESEVAQSCPTLSDPMDCSPPGSSVHGIFQARVLEWGAILVPSKIQCTLSHWQKATFPHEVSPLSKQKCEMFKFFKFEWIMDFVYNFEAVHWVYPKDLFIWLTGTSGLPNKQKPFVLELKLSFRSCMIPDQCPQQ